MTDNEPQTWGAGVIVEEPTYSTNNAVVEQAETVVYLSQYQYNDEPGSFWPAKAFKRKADAEKHAAKHNHSCGIRFYSVTPLILEGPKL